MVGLTICDLLFSITLPLTKLLQNPQIDLSFAMECAATVSSALKELRNEEEKFSVLFKKAEDVFKSVFDNTISVPRTCNIQTKRDNTPHSTPEEYYRRTMFYPCVDTFIQGLEDRFGSKKELLKAFNCLLPSSTDVSRTCELRNLALYFDARTSLTALEAEYAVWCHKWKELKHEDKPKSILAIIDSCNPDFYPEINFLLKVLATLPVSTTEVERYANISLPSFFLLVTFPDNSLTSYPDTFD